MIRGVTHFNRVSGVKGVYTGPKGSEQPLMPVRKITQDIVYTDFAHVDKVGTLKLTEKIPAGAFPLGWLFTCTAPFDDADNGETVSAATMQVGIEGDIDRFSADTAGSVFTEGAVGSLAIAEDAAKGIEDEVEVAVTVTIVSSNDVDFDGLTSGAGTIEVFYLASQEV